MAGFYSAVDTADVTDQVHGMAIDIRDLERIARTLQGAQGGLTGPLVEGILS